MLLNYTIYNDIPLLSLSFSKDIKPAPPPFLGHVPASAISPNTTVPVSERGPLPNFISARQSTHHQATAAGSGKFSFFWSLDTVIAPVASSLRETIPREQIRDLPFTVKTGELCVALLRS